MSSKQLGIGAISVRATEVSNVMFWSEYLQEFYSKLQGQIYYQSNCTPIPEPLKLAFHIQ